MMASDRGILPLHDFNSNILGNLLQQSSDRTIGTSWRAQTNREAVTPARVRWWRTLEYSILAVTMEQSDDDLHTFQSAVQVIQTCLMKFIVRT